MIKIINGRSYPEVFESIGEFIDKPCLTVQSVDIKPVNAFIQAEITYAEDKFQVVGWQRGEETGLRTLGHFHPSEFIQLSERYDVLEVYSEYEGQSQVLMAVFHRFGGWLACSSRREILFIEQYVKMGAK